MTSPVTQRTIKLWDLSYVPTRDELDEIRTLNEDQLTSRLGHPMQILEETDSTEHVLKTRLKPGYYIGLDKASDNDGHTYYTVLGFNISSEDIRLRPKW